MDGCVEQVEPRFMRSWSRGQDLLRGIHS
jgi:hypothetical protein